MPFRIGSNAVQPVDTEGFVTSFDARQYFSRLSSTEKTVGSPREVEKTPVFDNAPLLRLKEGDKLVRGRRWLPRKTGSEFVEHDSYFLSSGGKFYDLGDYGSETKLRLWDLSCIVHFDWDVTLENAALLYQISKFSRVSAYSLGIQQYCALREALQKDFPKSLLDDTGLLLKEPRIETTDKAKYAVFDSINFDSFQNKVFHNRILIGLGVYTIKQRLLIAGPPRVPWWLYSSSSGEANEPAFPFRPTANGIAQAKAADAKFYAFQQVVASVVPEWQSWILPLKPISR